MTRGFFVKLALLLGVCAGGNALLAEIQSSVLREVLDALECTTDAVRQAVGLPGSPSAHPSSGALYHGSLDASKLTDSTVAERSVLTDTVVQWLATSDPKEFVKKGEEIKSFLDRSIPVEKKAAEAAPVSSAVQSTSSSTPTPATSTSASSQSDTKSSDSSSSSSASSSTPPSTDSSSSTSEPLKTDSKPVESSTEKKPEEKTEQKSTESKPAADSKPSEPASGQKTERKTLRSRLASIS